MSGTLQAIFQNQRSFGPPPPTTIGEAYGGGYYAGKIAVGGGGVATHYLIVAPRATGESYKQWKIYQTNTAGTDSLINGPANSAAMNNTNHPAAYFCEGLTIGGYTDWYMPAKNELEVLYFFLKPTTATNNTSYGANANAVSPEPINTNYSSGIPAQTSASLFVTGNSEALYAGIYWSSTQIDDQTAYVQSFDTGIQTNIRRYKDYSNNVRAVRRVPI